MVTIRNVIWLDHLTEAVKTVAYFCIYVQVIFKLTVYSKIVRPTVRRWSDIGVSWQKIKDWSHDYEAKDSIPHTRIFSTFLRILHPFKLPNKASNLKRMWLVVIIIIWHRNEALTALTAIWSYISRWYTLSSLPARFKSQLLKTNLDEIKEWLVCRSNHFVFLQPLYFR